MTDPAIDRLFLNARTPRAWLETPVGDDALRQLYNVLRMAPTANNGNPARFIFLRSAEAKSRLEPLVNPGNRTKVRSAPVCVIIGYDLDFHRNLDQLQPYKPHAANAWTAPERRQDHAFRNGSLQGAYLIMAARALGLDCGPMSGFDQRAVDQEFFADTQVRSNFLCCLGYGDNSQVRPRGPRLSFDRACQLL